MSRGALPHHITRALERLTEGVARNDIARRASAISDNYRNGGGSVLIRDRTDALAYVLARMPATFAAVSACLDAVRDVRPTYEPLSVLDIGAGPGTATWAASQAFLSLTRFALLDANPALKEIAGEFALNDRPLGALTYQLGDALVEIKAAAEADLVIASYAIGELQNAQRAELIERMWSKTKGVLLIVEPGTPDGYSRIIAARDELIAMGATVIAPCPHDYACPLDAPDWCHFAQRLSRSRDHMHLKNAAVPFEDEKFSYVAVTRTPVADRRPRVLAPIMQTKVEIAAKLCQPTGRAEIVRVPRRDKPAYAAARHWRWGEAADH